MAMPIVRWTQLECRPRKLNETQEEQIRTPWRPEREASSSPLTFLQMSILIKQC